MHKYCINGTGDVENTSEIDFKMDAKRLKHVSIYRDKLTQTLEKDFYSIHEDNCFIIESSEWNLAQIVFSTSEPDNAKKTFKIISARV